MGRVALAVMPYGLVIVILSVGRMVPQVAKVLTATDLQVAWPALAGRVASPDKPNVAGNIGNITIPILSQPGVLIAMAALVTGLVFTLVSSAAAMGEPEKETDLLHEVLGWSFYLLLFAVFICFVWGLIFLG
ncbi:hypothetical protein [uncultured Mobiluncus sp.]|uniref:hypothetical protein n=1 Tax=uncultured Mobiluncus sp. TaxID=293425 RepID=UPI00288AA80E|nr:hypothetical protein [uncultured Mobiluncus sp.]